MSVWAKTGVSASGPVFGTTGKASLRGRTCLPRELGTLSSPDPPTRQWLCLHGEGLCLLPAAKGQGGSRGLREAPGSCGRWDGIGPGACVHRLWESGRSVLLTLLLRMTERVGQDTVPNSLCLL